DIYDDRGSRIVQIRPKGTQVRTESDRPRRERRVEPRLVPHGYDAALVRGREVRPKPQLLRRSGRRRHVTVLRVQHDDVPGAEIVAVVVLAAVAGLLTPVPPRRIRIAQVVLVVPDRGFGTRLVTTPRWSVAVGVVGVRRIGIGVIANGEDGAGDGVEQRGGPLIAQEAPAVGDVARADEGYRPRGVGRHRGNPAGAVDHRSLVLARHDGKNEQVRNDRPTQHCQLTHGRHPGPPHAGVVLRSATWPLKYRALRTLSRSCGVARAALLHDAGRPVQAAPE